MHYKGETSIVMSRPCVSFLGIFLPNIEIVCLAVRTALVLFSFYFSRGRKHYAYLEKQTWLQPFR